MAKAKTARKRGGSKGGKKAAKKSAAKRARKKPARKSATRKKASKKSTRKSATRKKPARKKPARKKSAARKPRKRGAAKGKKLLTLTEVSKRTGISMPTLQRYKKEHQARLPTVGEGRSQRYPEKALPVFEQIKKENLKKRGRPRKSAAPAKKKAARKRAAGDGSGLISLSEIGRRTGISYPTLLRYVRVYGDQIPSHGTGRKRRFPPRAVPIFQKLRAQSRRGRRKGSGTGGRAAGAAGLAARVRRLETRNAKLEKQVKAMVKALRKPLVGKI